MQILKGKGLAERKEALRCLFVPHGGQQADEVEVLARRPKRQVGACNALGTVENGCFVESPPPEEATEDKEECTTPHKGRNRRRVAAAEPRSDSIEKANSLVHCCKPRKLCARK